MTRSVVRRSRPSGFTLIEILVVVAIIALLLTILLPSLQVAREHGRTALCASNLGEIFTASYMYAQESQDRLPNFGWVVCDEWWPAQLAKPLKYQYDVYACPSDQKPRQFFAKMDKHKIHLYQNMQPGSVLLDVSYSGACDTVDTDVSDRPSSDIHPALS